MTKPDFLMRKQEFLKMAGAVNKGYCPIVTKTQFSNLLERNRDGSVEKWFLQTFLVIKTAL